MNFKCKNCKKEFELFNSDFVASNVSMNTILEGTQNTKVLKYRNGNS